MIKATVFAFGISSSLLAPSVLAQTNIPHKDDPGVYAAIVLEAPAVFVAPSTPKSPVLDSHAWETPSLEPSFSEGPRLASPSLSSANQPEASQAESIRAESNRVELNQAASSQTETKRLKFNVAAYTGPLGDAGQLFAASKVDSEFRNRAVVTSLFEREQGGAVLPPWEDRIYTWSAPHFYHQPLYFQQINLERYGVGSRPLVSPIHSAAHFYGSLALWPAKMIWNWPTESVYSLGHQRPGDCVNYQRYTWSE